MSFAETDSFDTAAAEAEAELGGSEVTTDDGPPAEATTSEVVEESPAPEETTSTPPWYDGHDEDTIEVNGVEVSLADLRNGYLRQSDYTRKTQELADVRKAAQWAQDFQAQLRDDPMGVLTALAQKYKLLPSDAQQFDPDEVEPHDLELHQVRQEIEDLKIKRFEEEIRREVADIRGRYADFDPEIVLPMIAELGSQGIGLSIEQGYFLWKGQESDKREKAAAAAKAKADQIAATEAGKRQAQVEAGQSAAGVSDDDAARYRTLSFEEIAAEVWPDDYKYIP